MRTTKNFTILAGSIPEKGLPQRPFSPLTLQFCQDFAHQLQHHPIANEDAAWAAFSFWLRPRKLEQYKTLLTFPENRLGRGMTFHIAPANMPTMFLYSFFISLLAGNANIVRLSPRLLPKVRPVCEVLSDLLNAPVYQPIKSQNAVLTYGHDRKITDWFSKHCDSRVIWGGDKTIKEIRKSPLPPMAIDIPFADRYSLAILDSDYVAPCSEEELKNAVHHFYLDTYEVDQNACSSPRILLWLDSKGESFTIAQQRWWQAVTIEIQKYDLAAIKVSRKYAEAWKFAMHIPEISHFAYASNRLYVYTLSSLSQDFTQLSGAFGQFFQYPIRKSGDIIPYMTSKVQTITTLNIDIQALRTQLIQAGITGVDRIVPFGQAMDMDIIWDGRNLLDTLTRIIR